MPWALLYPASAKRSQEPEEPPPQEATVGACGLRCESPSLISPHISTWGSCRHLVVCAEAIAVGELRAAGSRVRGRGRVGGGG
eukprot:scaffold16656_cov44-Phaeocystis_antarctica.AAC.1